MTGTKMFLISDSGITIAQLSEAPLSVASVSPATAPQGTQVRVRGSGFENGVALTFGTSEAIATFVDQNTLLTTVPPISPGPVRVTVTNPNGHTYSLDVAFTLQ
jgi:spore coat protein U-like protein